MKNILLIVVFAALSMASKAQNGTAAAFPLAAGDTLTNVDSVSKVIKCTAGYNAMGIQVLVNKLSGTLSGKAYLFESMDGTNFQIHDSASYVATQTSSYYTPTYTNSATFNKVTTPGVYYQVLVVSTATVSAPVKVLYTQRKDLFQ